MDRPQAASYAAARRAACSLLVLASSCRGDSTEPTPTPADVSGLYVIQSETSRATCDPADAYEVLNATLGDGTLSLTFRVEQLEGQVRITPVSGQGPYGPVTFEDTSPRIVPMEADGSLRIESDRSDALTLDGRTFFIQVTGHSTGGFDREAQPIGFSLTSTFTQVYREGSADAAVFASCTQTQTNAGSRTGD